MPLQSFANLLRLLRPCPAAGARPRVVPVIGNIVEQDVDAIVSASDPALRGGTGVDGAIHTAAGPELRYHSGRSALDDPWRHGIISSISLFRFLRGGRRAGRPRPALRSA
jgi:hypothetical protein